MDYGTRRATDNGRGWSDRKPLHARCIDQSIVFSRAERSIWSTAQSDERDYRQRLGHGLLLSGVFASGLGRRDIELRDAPSGVVGGNAGVYGQWAAMLEYMVSNSTGAGGTSTQVAQANQIGSSGHVIYEENDGFGGGTATQAQANEYTAGVTSGVLQGYEFFANAGLGITEQNEFVLPQWQANGGSGQGPIWGVATHMDTSGILRPQFLTQELTDNCIGSGSPSLLTSSVSGASPTWTQNIDWFGTTVSSVTSHYLHGYLLSNGCVALFNTSTTNSYGVTLSAGSGVTLPSGSVTEQQVTSTNPNDNNESTENVSISTAHLSNFNPASTITLPPFSMTTFSSATPGCTTSNPAISQTLLLGFVGGC